MSYHFHSYAARHRHLGMYRANRAVDATTIPCSLFMLNFRLIVDDGLVSEVCCGLMASRPCIPLSSRSLSASNLGLSLFPIPAARCNAAMSVPPSKLLMMDRYGEIFTSVLYKICVNLGTLWSKILFYRALTPSTFDNAFSIFCAVYCRLRSGICPSGLRQHVQGARYLHWRYLL